MNEISLAIHTYYLRCLYAFSFYAEQGFTNIDFEKSPISLNIAIFKISEIFPIYRCQNLIQLVSLKHVHEVAKRKIRTTENIGHFRYFLGISDIDISEIFDTVKTRETCI